jgi:hypothetical protein
LTVVASLVAERIISAADPAIGQRRNACRRRRGPAGRRGARWKHVHLGRNLLDGVVPGPDNFLI